MTASESGAYDDIAERIVRHAKRSAGLYNEGDVEGSARAAKQAFNAFKRAAALEPQNPQAYLHLARFYHNTHRFEEAVHISELAVPLVADITSPAPSGASWSEYLRGSIAASKIGAASIRRDYEYSDGQGNLTAALNAAMDQIAVAPKAPHFLFDAATIASVLGPEHESEDFVDAYELFTRSQQAAADAAAAFLRRDQAMRTGSSSASDCPHLASVHLPRTLAHATMGKGPPADASELPPNVDIQSTVREGVAAQGGEEGGDQRQEDVYGGFVASEPYMVTLALCVPSPTADA